MALKHWGGTPREPLAEWRCPTCGTEQTGPLKAGCQACGAGADGRKVEEKPVGASAPLVQSGVAKRPAEPLAQAPVRPEYLGFDEWQRQYPNADDLLEAFMAGVAWARAQAVVPEVIPSTRPSAAPTTLVQMDIAFSDAATCETIIAALAFYRDNQLQYGAVPGQLTAEQVTDLITRLSPQEVEIPQ
jgi:hypothetical protein